MLAPEVDQRERQRQGHREQSPLVARQRNEHQQAYPGDREYMPHAASIARKEAEHG